jgi:hypothetical protein
VDLLCTDLRIDALLNDPMTQAAMRADRVDPSKLKATLLSVAIDRHRDERASARFAFEGQGAPLALGDATRLSSLASSRKDASSFCQTLGASMRPHLCGAP